MYFYLDSVSEATHIAISLLSYRVRLFESQKKWCNTFRLHNGRQTQEAQQCHKQDA